MARTVTVTPGRDGDDRPYGKYTVEPRASDGAISVPCGWVDHRAREDDWAVIVVPHIFEGVDGGRPHAFDFAVFRDAVLDGAIAQVSGYPVDLTSSLMDSTHQFYHADRVKQVEDRVLTYDLDTSGGQSGSALYVRDAESGKRIVIGVHTMGDTDGNSATRITPAIVKRIDHIIAEAG